VKKLQTENFCNRHHFLLFLRHGYSNNKQTVKMGTSRNMVSFDWAIKRLLRNKANFKVLEGFLSELLHRKIIIKNICESEGNQSDKKNKSNRVDILVEADGRELVIIELQFSGQDDYFQRMLYGVSKSISEHLQKGEPYSKVRKVYSVNIVYFDLGEGDDYVYHGTTVFTGMHTNLELKLNAKQQQLYRTDCIGDLYPEYYIIKVGKFNDVAEDTLDEWIYYLKNNQINDDFTAQGIDAARIILAYEKLSAEDKLEHDRMLEENRNRESEILTAFSDGEFKGRAEGEVERTQLKADLKAKDDQLKESIRKIICNLSASDMDMKQIAQCTNLPIEEVQRFMI